MCKIDFFFIINIDSYSKYKTLLRFFFEITSTVYKAQRKMKKMLWMIFLMFLSLLLKFYCCDLVILCGSYSRG